MQTSKDLLSAVQSRPVAEAAAWLSGASEGLSVLSGRRPTVQRQAAGYAVTLLTDRAQPADWRLAGLPVPLSARSRQEGAIPLSHPAVLRLARTAMLLSLAGLPGADKPRHWANLRKFFAAVAPPSSDLDRLREHELNARADIGDVADDVVTGLQRALDRHLSTDGADAYLTGLARTNLATAYRVRGGERDLAEAVALTEYESHSRTERYGPFHPVTLVARSLHSRALLAMSDASTDVDTRHRLAAEALEDINEVRAARDRLFGSTSSNSIRSRKYEGQAFLLLDQPEKARVCLELTLAIETARHDGRAGPGSGFTVLYLARAYAALGDTKRAAEFAAEAARRQTINSPGGPSHRAATALLNQLRSG